MDDSESGEISKVAVIFEGTKGSKKFGSALVGIGDVNNDDIDDFAIGAPNANEKAGAVAIVYGLK